MRVSSHEGQHLTGCAPSKSPAVTAIEQTAVQEQAVQTRSFGTILVGELSADRWKETIILDQQPTLFKLDTGAMASVLPLSVFRSIRPDQQLDTTTTILSGFDHSTVRPEGTATIKTTYQDKSNGSRVGAAELRKP